VFQIATSRDSGQPAAREANSSVLANDTEVSAGALAGMITKLFGSSQNSGIEEPPQLTTFIAPMRRVGKSKSVWPRASI